jgi:hypothetical protein
MKRLLKFFSPERATVISFLLFLACVPSFVFCRTHHFSAFGHEYSTNFLDEANDVAWRLGFFIAMILIFRSEITFRYAFIFAMSVGFLLIASPLNFCGVLILPVTGALCLFALAVMLGWMD